MNLSDSMKVYRNKEICINSNTKTFQMPSDNLVLKKKKVPLSFLQIGLLFSSISFNLHLYSRSLSFSSSSLCCIPHNVKKLKNKTTAILTASPDPWSLCVCVCVLALLNLSSQLSPQTYLCTSKVLG